MGSRIQTRPKGVRLTSSWPCDEMPEKKVPRKRSTGWVLAISIDPDLNGLVTYYPAGSQFSVPQEDRTSGRQILHIDNGTWNGKKITTKPFYRVATKEQAEAFAGTFCSMGHDRSESLLPHQEGILWGFNWSSLTNAMVAIASQVADHFFNDRWDEAWAVGKAFGAEIEAAERAIYETKEKVSI